METQAPSVLQWAGTAFPTYRWDDAVVAHGAFHDVAIADAGVALRVTIGADALRRAQREASILEGLRTVSTGAEAPSMRSPVVVHAGRAGYLTSVIPGAARPPHDWGQLRAAYSELLTSLASAAVEVVLPPARQWCGGQDLRCVVERHLSAGLGGHLRAALERVDALRALPAPRCRVLVHGDFGPHNTLWSDGAVTGLIDWDHACVDDPAMDVAPLIGFHGAEAAAEVASAEDVERGMVHRATLPLQVAAAAALIGRAELRDHAVDNFVGRLEAGTLFDPQGGRPSAR